MYALCTRFPELVAIFCELGFTDITKPGMLQSAGRFMTPAKGASLKHIPLEHIRTTLAEHGFDTFDGPEQNQ